MDPMIGQLLQSGEPAVRFKAQTGVMGHDPGGPLVASARLEVRGSPVAQALLALRDAEGRLPYHPYRKWIGAHWALAQLADVGYPAGDSELIPLREQVYAWLLDPAHVRGVPVIRGRARRCASQEGNAILATYALGLADERTEELAQRLMRWQWPDGGWNCDRRPEAENSSYHETLIPLRALALHARLTGDPATQRAVEQGAEVLLKRRLFLRQSTSEPIAPAFAQLHYPYYWRYNILYALRVMGEIGAIGDARCAEALDLIASKRLPDGGWPAEAKYFSAYRGGDPKSGTSTVDWGGVSKKTMNPWVTAEALTVLRAAGRLDVA